MCRIKLEKKSPNEQSPKSTNGFSPRKATSRDNINDEYRKLYGSPHILNLSSFYFISFHYAQTAVLKLMKHFSH